MGSPDMFIEFYEECIKRKISDDDIISKEKLLVEISKKYKNSTVGITNKTQDEFTKQLGQHYKKILKVKK